MILRPSVCLLWSIRFPSLFRLQGYKTMGFQRLFRVPGTGCYQVICLLFVFVGNQWCNRHRPVHFRTEVRVLEKWQSSAMCLLQVLSECSVMLLSASGSFSTEHEIMLKNTVRAEALESDKKPCSPSEE